MPVPRGLVALLALLGWLMAAAVLAELPGDDKSGGEEPWPEVQGLALDPAKDWLLLTSGEVLQGKLEEFYADKLLFDSDALGEQEIELKKIRRLRTVGWYQVNLGDRGVGQGRLRLDEQQLRIDGVRQQAVARERVVSIYKLAKSELERWESKFTFGANVSSGNSDTTEINAKLHSERKTALQRTKLDYLGNYTASDDDAIDRNHRITLSHDIFKANRLFLRPVQTRLYHAPAQNIELQADLGAQLGYAVIDEKKHSWDLALGPLLRYLRLDEVATGSDKVEKSLAAAISSSWSRDLTQWLEVSHEYTVSLSPARTGGLQHSSLFSLAFEVTDRIDFDVDVVWDFTEAPLRDANNQRPNKNDYRLGLGIDF